MGGLMENYKIVGPNRNILYIPEGFEYKIDVEAGKISIEYFIFSGITFSA